MNYNYAESFGVAYEGKPHVWFDEGRITDESNLLLSLTGSTLAGKAVKKS